MAIQLGDAQLNITGDASELEKTFAGTAKKIGAGMAIAGAAITAALGVAVSKALEFGEGIGNIATLGVPNLNELKTGIMDVAQAIGVDLGDAAQATYDIISAGIEPAKAIEFLGAAAIAAKAGIGELGDAVDLGTTVMNAFGLSVEDTGKIFDQTQKAIKLGKTNIAELGSAVGKVAPLLKGAGVASEEMFAALAQLTGGGLSTAESVTGLRAVIASILKPTAEAKKAAEDLEIEWNSQGLAAEGLSGLMAQLAEATGGNIDQISALIPSVEAMPAALRLMADGGAQLASKLDQVINSTGESQAAFQRFVDANPGEKLDRLRVVVEVLAIKIGDVLVPVLGLFVDKIIPILMGISEWITENPKLSAGIVLVTAAVGALLLVLGSLLLIMPGVVATMGVFAGAGGVAGATAAIAGAGGLVPALGAAMFALSAWGIVLVAAGLLVFALVKSVGSLNDALREQTRTEEALAAKVEEVNERMGTAFKDEEEARLGLNATSKQLFFERIAMIQKEMEAELGRSVTLQEAAIEENRRENERATIASATADVVVASAKREIAASTKATEEKVSNSKKQVSAMQARMGAITKNSGVFAGAAKAELTAGNALTKGKIESSEKEIAAGRVRIGEIIINGKKFIATISEERQAQIDAENIKVKSLKREIDAAIAGAAKRKQLGQQTANAVRKTSSEIAKANEDAATTVEEVWDKSSEGVQKAILNLARAADKGTDSIGKSFKDLAPEVQAATNKVVDSMMKTSPFSKNSPSLVDQTQGGLNQMADMWSGFADGLSTLIAGLVEKMAQLSPFSKQSPSLVDQVKSGTKEMAKQWASYTKFLESISGESMPMPTGLGASLAGVAGTVGGAATSSASLAGTAAALNVGGGGNSVSLTIDMSGATVRSDADIEIISQRLFRHVDRTLRRAGIQTGFATS